jgi:Uma2 family endonuclease
MSQETPEFPANEMNLPLLKHPDYNLADWEQWDGRWELIDGVAYDMTPAPNTTHQGISLELTLRIGNLLEEARQKSGGGCRTFVAPTDVYLGPRTVVQPDLLIVCDPAKISVRGIEGPPDLVVEILSPRTASKDRTRKQWTYEAAGVLEYLIVDPEEKVGVLLRLEQGRYQEAARVEWGGRVSLLGGILPVQLG